MMPVQVFVKIDGVSGESTDESHGSWIEAHSVHWGINLDLGKGIASQNVTQDQIRWQRSLTARNNFSPFMFTKAVDLATPMLMTYKCTNKETNITVEFCRAGGDKMKYLEFKFEKCRLSGLELSVGDAVESLPVERVWFDYDKITLTYSKQSRSSGSSTGSTVASYNLETS